MGDVWQCVWDAELRWCGMKVVVYKVKRFCSDGKRQANREPGRVDGWMCVFGAGRRCSMLMIDNHTSQSVPGKTSAIKKLVSSTETKTTLPISSIRQTNLTIYCTGKKSILVPYLLSYFGTMSYIEKRFDHEYSIQVPGTKSYCTSYCT